MKASMAKKRQSARNVSAHQLAAFKKALDWCSPSPEQMTPEQIEAEILLRREAVHLLHKYDVQCLAEIPLERLFLEGFAQRLMSHVSTFRSKNGILVEGTEALQ